MKTKQNWIAASSRESENLAKLMSERDWCYFIPPQPDNERGFIPACVIENVQGYLMMAGNGQGSSPWFWGKTLDDANETCQKVNAGRGIDSKRALDIVLSTMADFTK